MKQRHTGSCHCGAVQFAVAADIKNDRNALCNCSRCHRLGFLHHHVEQSDFELLQGAEHIQVYRFGTLNAEHMFCRVCGVQSFYRSRSDPHMMDINLRCLADIDVYALRYWLVDGQNWAEAQAARRTAEAAGRAPVGYAILAPFGDGDAPATQRAFYAAWH